MTTNKKDFEAFGELRLNMSPRMKECPMCSDLHHGFLSACEYKNKEIEKLQAENKKLRDLASLCSGPNCDETGRSIIKDGVKARQCLKDMEK